MPTKVEESNTHAHPSHEPVYRRNFAFFLADNVLFNLAMNIMGPTTVIPDFIRRLTASEVLIGLTPTLFDVGSTLPQLFIARYILRVQRKKWWFVIPNIPARVAMVVFAVVAVLLGKDRPEALLVAFLACYGVSAIGTGISNVPWWVMAGTSLDNRWRARVLGLTAAIVGVLMLVLSPLVGSILGDEGLAFPNNYALIFGIAGLLFTLSILPVVFVREISGGKVAEKLPSIAEFLPQLGHILRADVSFRAMIIARMLTSLFAMASPFYIGFATVRLGLTSAGVVPTLLVMQTVGGLIGALLYTWLGATHSLLYIRLGLGLAAFVPISALLALFIGPFPLYLGFLVMGMTVGYLFASYHNWVIGYATVDLRPVYAGLFNTLGAVVALLTPFIGGTIAQFFGYEALFIVALGAVLGALFIVVRYIRDPRPT